MNKKNETTDVRVLKRVALRADTRIALVGWKMQLQNAYPTFEPTDSDLFAWAIERSPLLSKNEMIQIKKRYFDDVRELEALVKHLRKAKAQGDQAELSKLLSKVSIRNRSLPVKSNA